MLIKSDLEETQENGRENKSFSVWFVDGCVHSSMLYLSMDIVIVAVVVNLNR